MWGVIKDSIQTAQNLFVPNKIILKNKVRPHTVTIDNNLHCLLKDKRYLFKFYKKYRTKTAQYNYNIARNRVSFKIKLMKKSKENSIAKNIKKDPKKIYQYVASKTVKKEGIYDLINKDGKLTSDDKEKCDILNSFFSSVFTIEDTSNIPAF